MQRKSSLACKRALRRPLTGHFAVFALLLILLTTNAFAQHVANPYVGASVYVSPDYATEVQAAAQQYPAYASQIATVGKTPTFVWLDRIGAIYGGSVSNGRLGSRHTSTRP